MRYCDSASGPQSQRRRKPRGRPTPGYPPRGIQQLETAAKELMVRTAVTDPPGLRIQGTEPTKEKGQVRHSPTGLELRSKGN